jgi:catechol 2,3-dioxygenase-like lactoylglutathione lyase family enzyme
MPAPFNIIGIDHIVLRAVDPAALERFYLNVLGLSFEKREVGLTQLRAGNALIDIVPADEAGPAERHIEQRRRQPRSPVPEDRPVRCGSDHQASSRARHRLRRGDLALWRRG